MTQTLAFHSHSADETRWMGTLIGTELHEGDFLALQGELGSGKTTLAGGIGVGLGIEGALASPTYLLCREHPGRHLLFHLDAYFGERMESLLSEGLAERLAGPGVIIAEWPERMEAWLPSDRLDIQLEGAGNERVLAFQATGPHGDALLERVRGAMEKMDESA